MPLLGGKRALSGVVGSRVATFPPPRLPRRVLATDAKERFALRDFAVRLAAIMALFSGAFCAEEVPKRYMFGTHLAVNI